MTEVEMKKFKLDDSLAQEVIAGVERTLKELMSVQAIAQPYQLKKSFEVIGDVSGIIGIVQKEISGSMVITFPKKTIFSLLQKFYKKSLTSIDHTVRMSVGELTNIIYGIVQSSLNKQGMGLRMSIPNVISGDHHVVTNMATQNVLTIPFAVDGDEFTVSIALLKQGLE